MNTDSSIVGTVQCRCCEALQKQDSDGGLEWLAAVP